MNIYVTNVIFQCTKQNTGTPPESSPQYVNVAGPQRTTYQPEVGTSGMNVLNITMILLYLFKINNLMKFWNIFHNYIRICWIHLINITQKDHKQAAHSDSEQHGGQYESLGDDVINREQRVNITDCLNISYLW